MKKIATVKTEAFEPRPSNQTQVEVCAAVEPTPTPTPESDDGGALPDTATTEAVGRSSALEALALIAIASLLMLLAMSVVSRARSHR